MHIYWFLIFLIYRMFYVRLCIVPLLLFYLLHFIVCIVPVCVCVTLFVFPTFHLLFSLSHTLFVFPHCQCSNFYVLFTYLFRVLCVCVCVLFFPNFDKFGVSPVYVIFSGMSYLCLSVQCVSYLVSLWLCCSAAKHAWLKLLIKWLN